jgi:hypothetical protein
MSTTHDPLAEKILDELADGQWHPLFKIRRNVLETVASDEKLSKSPKTLFIELLEGLVQEGRLLAGNNESYRFKNDELINWRNTSITLDRADKHYQPRYHGGILEDDGWELAGLRTYDMVHFHVEGDMTKRELYDAAENNIASLQIDEDKLYRLFTEDGARLLVRMREVKEERPEWGISGIRIEKNLRRRLLTDLPPRFVADMCDYYGDFAHVLLRGKMSSIIKHLPDPDDIQQQIYIWVMDAIQRYDATTSIPFGAYLSTVLNSWVYNLNRKSYGRSAADTELKYVRARNDFRAQFGREASQEDLASFLGVDIETVRHDHQLIDTVSNLRNVGAIQTDDTEVPLPSSDRVEDNIDRLVSNTLLSAALTTSARKERVPDGSIGLVGIYYEMWGGEKRTKRINSWLKTDRVQHAMARILANSKQILKETS